GSFDSSSASASAGGILVGLSRISGSCESAAGAVGAAGGRAGVLAAVPAGAGFAADAAGRAGAAAPVVVAGAGLAGPGSFDSSVNTKSNGCSRALGSYLIVALALSGNVASWGGMRASSVLPSRD